MKWFLIIVTLLIIVAAILVVAIPAKTPAQPAQIAGTITVAAPLPQEQVSSPIALSGQARGTWFFEASAPYELRDASGAVIAQGHVDAPNWMTEDFTPFAATITYPQQPAGSHGTLVLKNDNPSGDPAKDKSLSVPIIFR